jgi:hypothetical protein
MGLEQLKRVLVMGVVGVDVGVQRPGVDDQRDGAAFERTITAMVGTPARRSPRWAALRSDDLLDPLGDIASPASEGGPGAEAPPAANPEMLLEGGTGDVRDRDAAAPGLVAEASIEVVGELDGSALHWYASIPPASWSCAV